MLFLDRQEEMGRLDRLVRRREGGLAVVYGRRRVGKTRLLVEWVHRHHGVYFVADQSTAALQRGYFAQAVGQRLAGFGAVEYPDWRTLFERLSADAPRAKFHGPLVIDELPYLVASSPELPSVLQQWLDHSARQARLVVALAGSSQRLMQGLLLDGSAPLFGRAQELFELKPLAPAWLKKVLKGSSGRDLLEAWTAWGGIPRYWELADDARGPLAERVERLVLDPGGPLHQEPDRLLLEELPTAVEVRPVLDAIGAGAHRVSEIAGRIGRPATSLSRVLDRLIGIGLVERETPFGESAKDTKRSLYRISDPFVRLWFRVVAPNRGQLAAGSTRERLGLLERHWPALVGDAWEELCRAGASKLGEWLPAGRWWQGNAPEWDLVSRSLNGKRALLGECRAWRAPATRAMLEPEVRRLIGRAPPPFARELEAQRALFVPALAKGAPRKLDGVEVVTLDELI
jgi:AAA+ ATPase superfamily predicted ATPase